MAVVEVRDATDADLDATLAIYNALIDTTTVTWSDHGTTFDEWTAWFAAQQARGFPVLVAELDGEVVGVTSYGDFRDSIHWPGYRFSAELSVHVRGDQHGRGIGRRLLEVLLDRARTNGIHVMVAAVDGGNDASNRFHEAHGVEVVARMPELGRKFDRWLELVLLQRVLT